MTDHFTAAALDHLDTLGIDAPPEALVSYMVDHLDGVWAHIDRGFVEAFCRDQDIDDQVERAA